MAIAINERFRAQIYFQGTSIQRLPASVVIQAPRVDGEGPAAASG